WWARQSTGLPRVIVVGGCRTPNGRCRLIARACRCDLETETPPRPYDGDRASNGDNRTSRRTRHRASELAPKWTRPQVIPGPPLCARGELNPHVLSDTRT